MKIPHLRLLPYICAFILFLIPFFWLKPGEMDLGGDSSRLYFYDPLGYLSSQSLYASTTSGIGGEAVSYYSIPFIVLLFFLKSIFSSTGAISIINGTTLSLGFLFCFLTARELVKGEVDTVDKNNTGIVVLILSALTYVCTPLLIAGWDRAILSHIQIFLNPLMFYLLLKYCLSRDRKYLYIALLITFIFSLNFSYVAAPPVFSFYPISLLFIFCYTKFVRKMSIPFRELFMAGIAFLLLQCFHIAPHILNILTSKTDISQSIFSQNKIYSEGLDYFSAIAQSVKVSISFMNLPQLTQLSIVHMGFILFPFPIVLAFLHHRKNKTFLLTAIFFFIVMFFVTANISDTGLAIYKKLFNVPGFKMFRNFYGQWGYVYAWFYSLLLAQALVILMGYMKRKYIITLSIILFFVIVINSWSFMLGNKIKTPLWGKESPTPVLVMDPEYEKVLAYLKNRKIDGKILSFPFVGPGYQVISGSTGGLYAGPSTFSYLVGQSDYTGYEGIKPYHDVFLAAMKEKDINTLKKLISILNIRYIFHNADESVYNAKSPGFLFNYVKDFTPKTQHEYKEFLGTLPITLEKSFDDKYFLYSVNEDIYVPHIYTTNAQRYSTNPFLFPFINYFSQQKEGIILEVKDSKEISDPLYVEANLQGALGSIYNNSHLHKHEPFVQRQLNEWGYGLSVLREKYNLWRNKNNKQLFVDLGLLHLSKRVFELDKWGSEMPVLRDEYSPPDIYAFHKINRFYNWESSLYRYKGDAEDLINFVASQKEDLNKQKENQIKINEQFYQHQIKLHSIINGNNKSVADKKYLNSIVRDTFSDLFKSLNLDHLDTTSHYVANVLPEKAGEYSVYAVLRNKDTGVDVKSFSLRFDQQIMKPKDVSLSERVINFGIVEINDANAHNLFLDFNHQNLITDSAWLNSGDNKNDGGVDSLTLRDISGNESSSYAKETGLLKEIGWLSGTQYLISFDYQTFGDDYTVKLYERKDGENYEKSTQSTLFEKVLNSNGYASHQSIVTSHKDSVKAYLQISKMGNQADKSTILIKNLSVIELITPRIILEYKPRLATEIKNIPNINFTKVNSTKYYIDIKNVQNPYFLVFSEAFSSNWKLVDTGKDNKTLQGQLSRVYKSFMEMVVQGFVPEQEDELIEPTLVNPMVSEGHHKNIFLNRKTFETIGKESVAEDRHLIANSYTNAWFITPEDMSNQKNYTLVLEMVSQQKLYGFLVISLITFTVILTLFIKKLIGR